MTVLITLTTAGTDSGPFNLYSNVDGYTSAFALGISRATLLAGYSSASVPDYTSVIRIMSMGVCINSIDISVEEITTTTTTSSPTTTTTTTVLVTTTSTTTPPTTTTTTTVICTQWMYNVTLFSCGDCIETGIGTLSNSEPLTIGKWCSYAGYTVIITSLSYCSADIPGSFISDSSLMNICGDVVCPTTTTTTTL